MSTENAKESAFPNSWTVEKRDGSVVTTIVHGLTKREEFAKAAMAAIIASPNFNGNSEQDVAIIAIRHADALLLELEKPV